MIALIRPASFGGSRDSPRRGPSLPPSCSPHAAAMLKGLLIRCTVPGSTPKRLRYLPHVSSILARFQSGADPLFNGRVQPRPTKRFTLSLGPPEPGAWPGQYGRKGKTPKTDGPSRPLASATSTPAGLMMRACCRGPTPEAKLIGVVFLGRK
jgi:hypothetical protein